MQRAIQSIDFPGSVVAVFRVVAQYAEPIGHHREVFVMVKDGGKWSIRLHRMVD